MFLLIGIAVVAALALQVSSTIAAARRRKARRYFALGFSAGWLAASIVGRKRRRRTLRALAAVRTRISRRVAGARVGVRT